MSIKINEDSSHEEPVSGEALEDEPSLCEPFFYESTPSIDEPQILEAKIFSEIWDVLALTNRARRDNGIQELIANNTLGDMAYAHAGDMARHNFLGHTGSDGSSLGDRAKRHGLRFSSLGENAHKGPQSAQGAFEGWMNSSGHRKNILNPGFRFCAVSLVRSSNNTPFWCQVFSG